MNEDVVKSGIERKVKSRKRTTKESRITKILKNYLNFYNTNLRKKQIIIYIVLVIIFGIFVTNIISQIDVTKEIVEQGQINSQISIVNMLEQKIFLTFLIVLAGITPFVYIPVIAALFVPYIYSNDILGIINNSSGTVSLISSSISSVLQFIGISLAVATGIYYCKNATKRFKYTQGKSFGMFDLKKQIYEIRKDDEKLEKLLDQRQKKIEKEEKLNVKIEYLNILISIVISIAIVSVSSLISLI